MSASRKMGNFLPETFEGGLRWLIAVVIAGALVPQGVIMFLQGKILLPVTSLGAALLLLAVVVYWPFLPTIALIGLAVTALCPVIFYTTIKFCKWSQIGGRRVVTFGIALVLTALVSGVIGSALVGSIFGYNCC